MNITNLWVVGKCNDDDNQPYTTWSFMTSDESKQMSGATVELFNPLVPLFTSEAEARKALSENKHCRRQSGYRPIKYSDAVKSYLACVREQEEANHPYEFLRRVKY